MASQTFRVNVLVELDRLGRKYEFTGESHVKVLCPFHEDQSPSASINTETGAFKCFACKKTGDFIAYVCMLTGHERTVVFADLSQRYHISGEPCVDMEVIEAWHSRLWQAPPLLQALHDRGVTDEMIRERRLGESDGRVMIPIWEHGAVVNVRKYLPGAPGAQKMKNMKGRSKPRFFMEDQLKYGEIVVCGGEMKALVAAAQLNKHNIGAVAPTCGEGNWHESLTERLMGKRVAICFDVDEEGVDGANMVASKLYVAVEWVGIIALPLKLSEYPHGDVNDFVMGGGSMIDAYRSAVEWKPRVKAQILPSGDVVETDLTGAYSSELTGKRVRVECVVSAIDSETYVVPRETKIKCDRAQDFCGECPVAIGQLEKFTISPENPAILEMVGASKAGMRPAMMSAIGIPGRCPSAEFEVEEYMQADEVRLSPKLEILTTSVTREYQRAVCVRRGLALNETYALTGRQYPHPRNQSAAMLISDFDAVGDALSHYDSVPSELLMKFRPKEWTLSGVKEKLHEIYSDLVRNVTHVRMRANMHVLMDMVWHSPLFITFNGEVIKGYVEALICGDSSHGKSEASKKLLEHYGVGAKVECKNATVAGLLGGLQQIAGRWFVTWGVIPTHDKRMVILEELKGASTDVISKLTEMRSSGIAELPKIEKRRTTARTRLLALSNPRGDGRTMASYSFGVEAIKELIGAPEDVRRFDACMVVANGEIDPKIINTPSEQWPAVPHVFDQESCRSLVLWAWTRRPEAVRFESEAERLILNLSSTMCDKFTSEIPIVDVASMRMKLARLSAAIACRTFSGADGPGGHEGNGHVSENGGVLVRTCHVEYVGEFLDAEYSKIAMGYVDFTRAIRATSSMDDPDAVKTRISRLPHARDFVDSALRTTKFDHQDMQDWSGLDRMESSVLASLLVRKRAIVRHGRSYVKTPGFIELLKTIELPDLPEHVRNKEDY